MKQLIKIVVCCVYVLQLQAQQNLFKPSNTKNTKNTLSNWQVYKKATALSAKELALNKTALLLNKEDELHLLQRQSDETGMQHYRYQQKYKGIPVEGAVYLMHERNGKVELSNGRLIRNLNIKTQPTIGITEARQIASNLIECDLHKRYTSKNDTNLNETTIKNVSKVILDPQFTLSPSNYNLAYKVEILDIHSFISKDVYVDAHNGHILLSLDKIHQCTDIEASGPTNYSGNVSFDACRADENTYALKSSIGDLGALEVLRYGAPFSTLISDAEPTFGDTYAGNEVMWASQQTFDYFNNVHSTPYPDTLTKSMVHYISNEGFNDKAFYADGIGLFYGDGDQRNYSSLTSVDIVAHELTHGLTNFTADFIYIGQPGALSESFSDIFGEMVENKVKPNGNDWIIGSEVVIKEGKNGMRNMRNPKDQTMLFRLPDTYYGENWKNLPKDNEGVHYNCGVHNYWFYLLSEGNSGTNDNNYNYNVEGIGKDKAAAIAYRNLTYYLTPTSHYEDAKLGSIQAAKDLYPNDSNVLNQTIEAWNAVGLPNCYTSDSTVLGTMVNYSTALLDWNNNENNWINAPFEQWNRVTLNQQGCIVELDLSNTSMNGDMLSSLGALKHLKVLNLQNNNLYGTIPASFGNLSNLEKLLLNNNDFQESIPETFQYLENLVELDVSNNRLEGCYEAALDSLCHLLSPSSKIDEGNQFKVSWETFCEGYACRECRLADSLSLLKVHEATDGLNWTNTWNLNEPVTNWYGVTFDEYDCVEGLDLSDNNLSGSIPPEIGDLYSLHYLYLDSNRLQGSIPYEMININNIIYIDLSNNYLSGCYNANLNDMNIKWDDAFICNNKISDGNFFDASWCDFYTENAGNCDTYLEMSCRQRDSLLLLKLYETTDGANWKNTWNLAEPIDQWYGITLNNKGCVTNLKIENNYLKGFIPNEIGYLTELRNLSFLNNKLTGIIPESIGNLSKLNTLTLTYNQLTGNIPTSLGDLSNLNKLYAYANQLKGEIPVELSKLRKLSILSLHKNQLAGTIPVQLENLNNLTGLNLSNNNLIGNIPPELGNLPKLKYLNLEQNKLDGGLPAQLSNLKNLIMLTLNNNNLNGCYLPELSNLCEQLSIKNFSNISDENNFEATWDDFCNANAGVCISPVLPGDFNADGIVNYNDMLYWGLANGNNGPSRPNAGINWAAQNATDWSSDIEGINGKHQDANGDGVVNEEDLLALELNYGNSTNNASQIEENKTFAFEMKVTNFSQTSFSFDLHIRSLNGSEYIDLHGLSASLNFSDFEIDTVFINKSRSIIPADQLKTFYNKKTETLDIAMTKTNRVNTRVRNDDVVLSAVVCIEINDLPGGDPPAIIIEGGGIVNEGGRFDSFNNSMLLPYFFEQNEIGSIPNSIPFAASIQHYDCKNLGAIYLNIIEGQSVPPYNYSWSTGSDSSFIDHLYAGKYSVLISDNSGKSQKLYFSIEDQWVNCSAANDCLEFLVLPIKIESGTYQAKNIQLNGQIDTQSEVYLKAANEIEINIGAQIENINLTIENCE